jgi:hypothetical protein
MLEDERPCAIRTMYRTARTLDAWNGAEEAVIIVEMGDPR